MVRTSPTPEDSPKAPTVTMVRCLQKIRETPRGRLIPRAPSHGGYEIVAGSKDVHPRALLAWFPRWCGDRLIADGHVDSVGRLTPLGILQTRKNP